MHRRADDVAIGVVASKILEHLERKAEEMQVEERLGRERLEQKIDKERLERERFEQEWEEEFSRTKRDDQAEKEHFVLGLQATICNDRKEDHEERKRLEKAIGEQETRITTLQGQFEGQNKCLVSRIDGEASRMSTLQGQLDGQRTRNNVFETRLSNHERKLDELALRLEQIDRQEKVNQDMANTRLQRLEAAALPAGRAGSQQAPTGPARARSSGAAKPRFHEVRPREALDLGMRGRPAKAVIPDTLIRSEHGKPNPRTLPPLPRINHGHGGPSSSRPAQPLTRNQSASPHHEGTPT